MKKILKIIGVALLVVILLAAGLLGYVSLYEYKPDERESITVLEDGQRAALGQEYTVLTYNIGYAALSAQEDFFMDGGSKVRPESETLIQNNLNGILTVLQENSADIYMLQEVDLASKRSYFTDQKTYLEEALDLEGIFAYNFNSKYVPYPLPTIGKVESGLLTMTALEVDAAERISLPVPFSWPVSTCNLKRCLLETRIPIEGTDKELVIFNLHLEAYDDGAGKIEQTNMLARLLEEEYQKGNYVIAGGDFNQTFDTVKSYPVVNREDWEPGTLEEGSLPKGFSFAADDSYPTCRLLNGPYSGNYEESQVYVIDGYIVSENVSVEEIRVIDTGFAYTDHQPVSLSFTLK